MHIHLKDLQAGAWLMVHGRYAQFVSAVGDAFVEIKYLSDDVATVVLQEQLRPVFLNRFIIERCGFRRAGDSYTDGVFNITIGGEDKLYRITAHKLQKPFFVHLISQLHIFQNIYREETGTELVFEGVES